jgi:hypothetical protein
VTECEQCDREKEEVLARLKAKVKVILKFNPSQFERVLEAFKLDEPNPGWVESAGIGVFFSSDIHECPMCGGHVPVATPEDDHGSS